MDFNWNGESTDKGTFLQQNLIEQPGTLSQMNNNSDGHSIKPATTTINGVVLHFSEDGTNKAHPSTAAKGNVFRLQENNNDENLAFTNNIKNPGVIRREVSFRQQCNSSGEKNHPHALMGTSSQTIVKQTPPSISNVTSVERARARALQAVNYYNSSVLGEPTMEPPAQYSGKL